MGGKVELFETFEQAIKREIKEEMGVDIEIIDNLKICNHIVQKESVHWVTQPYLCRIISGEPKIMEPTKHLEMKWFNIDNLPKNITIPTKNALKSYREYIEKRKNNEN